MQLVQQQQYLLFIRLDVLTADLKTETDSIRAEQILQEMRNIGNLLKELVSESVSDEELMVGRQ